MDGVHAIAAKLNKVPQFRRYRALVYIIHDDRGVIGTDVEPAQKLLPMPVRLISAAPHRVELANL